MAGMRDFSSCELSGGLVSLAVKMLSEIRGRHMEKPVLDVANLKFIVFGMGIPYL